MNPFRWIARGEGGPSHVVGTELERIASALEVIACHFAKQDKIFYTPSHLRQETKDEPDILDISDLQRKQWFEEDQNRFAAEGLQFDLFDEVDRITSEIRRREQTHEEGHGDTPARPQDEANQDFPDHL